MSLESYSMLAIRDTVLFPGRDTRLYVGSGKAFGNVRKMLMDKARNAGKDAANGSLNGKAQKGDNPSTFVVCLTQKQMERVTSPEKGLYTFGVLGEIIRVQELSPGQFSLLVRGCARFKVNGYVEQGEELMCTGNVVPSVFDEAVSIVVMKDMIRGAIKAQHITGIRSNVISDLLDQDHQDASLFLDSICDISDLLLAERQELLEEVNVAERLMLLLKKLTDRTQRQKLQKTLEERLPKKLSKKSIDLDEDVDSLKKYEKFINNKKNPEDARKQVALHLKRLRNMHASSPDYPSTISIMECIVSIPYNKEAQGCKDIQKVSKALEKVFGLEKVKEVIERHLAALQRSPSARNPIFLLEGSPGVGKTFIAETIAKARDLPYAIFSCGGKNDASIISGTRSVYVSSKPGFIVNKLIEMQAKNGIIIFDEIDKFSLTGQSDPAAALLPILDYIQNKNFRDEYIDCTVDLSRMTFICTANDISYIPKPLLDRMEVIHVNSYCESEKLSIAQDFLLPKIREELNFTPEEFSVTDAAVKRLIWEYTMEAGVRELERLLLSLAQLCAYGILKKEFVSMHVTAENLESCLKKPPVFLDKKISLMGKVGAAKGLAWTSVGGALMDIEVNACVGKGKVQITGNLGDSKKEAVNVALGMAEQLLKAHHIDTNWFAKHNIYVNFPGSAHKDGGSGGGIVFAAIMSAILKKTIRGDLAMTGALSYHTVFQIGGLREKLLAAHRSGIKTVLIPHENKKDLHEVSDSLRSELEIIYVNQPAQVLALAIEGYGEAFPELYKNAMESLPDRGDIKKP